MAAGAYGPLSRDTSAVILMPNDNYLQALWDNSEVYGILNGLPCTVLVQGGGMDRRLTEMTAGDAKHRNVLR